MRKFRALPLTILLFVGCIIMTGQFFSGEAASGRYFLNSSELTEVAAISGTAKLLEEKSIFAEGSIAPSLYQRRFQLTQLKVIRGGSDTLKKAEPILFSGFTFTSPLQRSVDTRNPTLYLEGQNFFDTQLSENSIDVLLLIGNPTISPRLGFMGRSAAVESGIYKGQPVRAFLLEGADATLSQALPLLVGWQPYSALQFANAITAPHPLIAIDALRIAIRSSASDQVRSLAQWLLHPTQPASVRAASIRLLGEAINQMPQGSKETDALISIIVEGWKAEHAESVEMAYLRALQSSSEQIKRSRWSAHVEAIANGHEIHQLVTLSRQLAEHLKR